MPQPAGNPPRPIPHLRSLGPEYDETRHGRHAAVLVDALRQTGESAARNIALAGHYGSGKSSVILGVQRKLRAAKVRFVNLSLSSLGFDDTLRARVQEDGSVPPVTNLIQKEIVKQLLYREAPSKMPGSRYFRIDAFRAGPASAWSGIVGISFVVLAALLGLRGRLEKFAPKGLLKADSERGWHMLLALGVFAALVWFLGLRSFQNKIRVESLSAGGAALTLKAKENSYFDQYLDEIVYFFQRTKTSVAIFEDLDRFKDPHIFETLRELNTVLNNSNQITSRPVRFVYAVRDSIFEDLAAAQAREEDSEEVSSRASALETRPPTNRTKFFDLVVPMVPFLTHRSARDLITEEFKDSPHAPTSEVVNLVGTQLTDMRLIRNVRNEFEVYSSSILSSGGLEGLSNDRLFAMLVYKNLHLEDFERIRLGTSRIDAAYKAYRAFVAHQTLAQSTISTQALIALRAGVAWQDRAAAAGDQLRELLPIVLKAYGGMSPQTQLTHRSSSFPPDKFGSLELWKAFQEEKDSITVSNPNGYRVPLTYAEVMTVLGERAFDAGIAQDEETLRRRSREAFATRSFVSRASMQELLARSDLLMPVDGGSVTLSEITKDLVSPLAHELLRAGLIDENFTLYGSDYHAVQISVNAMNFILHCVQVNQADYMYKFDGAGSITAVDTEVGSKFLRGESVFNVDVFNHYLATDDGKLENALTRLARNSDPQASFIDIYLNIGAETGAFTSSLVSAGWNHAFVHIASSSELDDEAKVRLTNSALQAAVPTVDYATTDDVSALLARSYSQMSCFTNDIDPTRADNLAAVSENLGALFDRLALLGVAQRDAVADRALYPVTRDNVATAIGDDNALALDHVGALKPTVYRYLVNHIGEYIGLLRPDELAVVDPEQFASILDDVSRISADAVQIIAERACSSCAVQDITSIASKARPGVVAARRFALTVANVAVLVEEFGLDVELADAIRHESLTDLEELEIEGRINLAVAITNSRYLADGEAVRLIGELELQEPLDVSNLDAVGRGRLPELVAGGLLADEAASYGSIADRPFTERERYFAKASQLTEYVKEIGLAGEDLALFFRSGRVPGEAKRVLGSDATYLASNLTRAGAIAVAKWAQMGHIVGPEVLAVLSETHTPAEYVIDLLTPSLPTIDTSDLDGILRALGDPYEPLTYVGHHRPKLPKRDGTTELLDELKRRDRVSSYKEATFGGGMRVSMRYA